MESSKKQAAGSASSLTDYLFGAKGSSQPSNSSGIFSSIFPPPSAAGGRKSPTSDLMGSLENHSSAGQAWKKGLPGFQDRVEPCPLSSSLYYGAQEDMYIKSSGPLPNYNKKEDDPNGNNFSAPGNLWDGSVYY
ncbi:PREDICTED: uncharacterized protein LOC109163835 isoform X2 [Ipomoea nil]|uniref:uncharacterized protein LOC109163835 isoform X2 n=1 Tax=Ipomoea nil TaxID=35883 RepID=UPI000901D4EB|nr:PREDICTED: uncharacterized protein LOC109163835 isoform X2 [Ipomoea nil]